MVWEALLDPTVLASVLPGCERLDLVGENDYEGALKIKIGPVQGTFQGKVKLEDLQPPTSYTMQVDGKGVPGFVKATAGIALEDAGADTVFRYDSTAQVGGRIASVGQRLLESSAKAIVKQSLEGLNQAMVQRAAAPAEGSEAPPPAAPGAAAPSQAEFAAGVAREVARDLIPPGMRRFLALAAFAIAVVIVYLIVT